MKKEIFYPILFVLLSFLNLASFSQNADSTKKIDDFYIDFSPPDIGAFTLLNVKNDNVANPGSTKEFAASLLNIVSGGGYISPGIAIDWSPGRSFWKTFTPTTYRKGGYLARNLQITFGTIADTSGTRVGLGLKWTFIDKTDPLLDVNYRNLLIGIDSIGSAERSRIKNTFLRERSTFLTEITKTYEIPKDSVKKMRTEVEKLLNPYDTTLRTKQIDLNLMEIEEILARYIKISHFDAKLSENDKIKLHKFCLGLVKILESQYFSNQEIPKRFEEAKKYWLERNWNAAVMTFGFGWVGNSIDNKWSNLNTQNFKTYLNGKFRIANSKRTQFVYLLSYTKPKNDSTNDSTIVSKVFAGLRFQVGTSKNRGSLDLGYGYEFGKVATYNKQNLMLNLGIEFKISEGVFLEIAGGFSGEPSKFFKNSNILALGSLKYAFHKKPRWEMPD